MSVYFDRRLVATLNGIRVGRFHLGVSCVRIDHNLLYIHLYVFLLPLPLVDPTVRKSLLNPVRSHHQYAPWTQVKGRSGERMF